MRRADPHHILAQVANVNDEADGPQASDGETQALCDALCVEAIRAQVAQLHDPRICGVAASRAQALTEVPGDAVQAKHQHRPQQEAQTSSTPRTSHRASRDAGNSPSGRYKTPCSRLLSAGSRARVSSGGACPGRAARARAVRRRSTPNGCRTGISCSGCIRATSTISGHRFVVRCERSALCAAPTLATASVGSRRSVELGRLGLLDDKVGLVTGAGHGMGRAHAVRMAEEGADVILCDTAPPSRRPVHRRPPRGTEREGMPGSKRGGDVRGLRRSRFR